MDSIQQHRAKKACLLCRERKRKCDGNKPCNTCRKTRDECTYMPRRRPNVPHTDGQISQSPTATRLSSIFSSQRASHGEMQNEVSSSHQHHQNAISHNSDRLRRLEANTPTVFFRMLGLNMDASSTPRLQCYAWNLGSQSESSWPSKQLSITEIVTLSEMREFALVYFAEVQPVYNFLDQESLNSAITQRWSDGVSALTSSSSSDAVLCGIAAIAGLFRGINSPLDAQLVQTTRIALEKSCNIDVPTVDDVVAWLLRVIYLRMTSSPHVTWMACCTLMHMVEATKLHFDSSKDSILAESQEDRRPDQRRRIYHIAQLFNHWVSLDCGKSKVDLRGATTALPESVWTPGQLALYRMSEFLDPDIPRDYIELVNGQTALTAIECSHPMLELLRCNIALCIFRRIRSLGHNMTDAATNQVLMLADRSLQSAMALVERRTPWWHIANIPFQLICVFLVIDNLASLARIQDALNVLFHVANVYKTKTTQESCQLARKLVVLKRCQRLEEITFLDSSLSIFNEPTMAGSTVDRTEGSSWVVDNSNLSTFDLDISQTSLDAFDLSQMFLPG